ncbi:MAG: hypothetical protein J7521_20800 [Caulobacter sp.]|nr:hypothetical protein [Caulobacter sp.]
MAIIGPRPGDRDDLGWNDGVKIKFRAPRYNGTLVIEAIEMAWSYHYRCQACGADGRWWCEDIVRLFGKWPAAHLDELFARAKCPCGEVGRLRVHAMAGYDFRDERGDEIIHDTFELGARRLRRVAPEYGLPIELVELWIARVQRWKETMDINLVRAEVSAEWSRRQGAVTDAGT